MSAISYSAPIFTEKHEKEELANISEEEKKEALKDIYGRRRDDDDEDDDDDDDDDDEIDDDDDDDMFDIPEELMEEFDNYLEATPNEEKKEYMEALEKAPPVVIEEESNPKHFLRAEEYDAGMAVSRLIEYWKVRVSIFQDSAFEPMTLEGAMRDVVPSMVQIPNYIRWLPADDQGRSVLCVDRTHINHSDYDQIIFAKLFFFAFHFGVRKKVSLPKVGIVLIVVNRFASVGYDDLKRKYVGLIVEGICQTFPFRLCSIHFCFTSISLRIQVPIVKFFMSREMRQRLILHTSMKNPTVLRELESYGLHRDKLPSTIGGTYFVPASWMEECKRIVSADRRHRRQKRQRNNTQYISTTADDDARR